MQDFMSKKGADMFTSKRVGALLVLLTLAVCFGSVSAQEMRTGAPILWEKVNIAERDLYWGAGGQSMAPVMDGMTFMGQHKGGTKLKFKLRDKAGREWIAKAAAGEAQSEVAATRLLWAIGYPTEVDYLVPSVSIVKWGNFKNVRFEARPEKVKRGGRWSWDDTQFKNSPEFAGLRIMMALLNNWDLKDENTVIFERDGRAYYAVSDLGASFGKLPMHSQTKSGRSVNEPEHYAGSTFIKTVDGGQIHFAYTASRADLLNGIKVEHGRWLADLLLQLSDRQINDAFRAANYDNEEAALLAAAFKARIAELDKATSVNVATN